MVVLKLRPIIEVYDNVIENYSIEAYEIYANSQNRSFNDCVHSVIENSYGEMLYESISDDEMNTLVALVTEETIRRLTDENKSISHCKISN